MLGGWISLAGRQNAAGSAALGNFDNKLIGLVPPERESRKKKRCELILEVILWFQGCLGLAKPEANGAPCR